MLLYEPPSTQADVHFRLFGVPVRVHPFFWVVTAILGLNTREGTPPIVFVSWILIVFVSILMHELGHAFTQRRFGGRPRIVLHGIGGLAICDDCDRRPSSQVLISLAGPAAGFAFALVVFVLVRLSGRVIGWAEAAEAPSSGLGQLIELPFLGGTLYWHRFESLGANVALFQLLQVNVLWGLVNLLPIYPLDGGRVAREVCTLRHPQRGLILSLQISVATAGAMALYGLFAWQSIFTAMMFGYLAFTSYQTISALRAHGY